MIPKWNARSRASRRMRDLCQSGPSFLRAMRLDCKQKYMVANSLGRNCGKIDLRTSLSANASGSAADLRPCTWMAPNCGFCSQISLATSAAHVSIRSSCKSLIYAQHCYIPQVQSQCKAVVDLSNHGCFRVEKLEGVNMENIKKNLGVNTLYPKNFGGNFCTKI